MAAANRLPCVLPQALLFEGTLVLIALGLGALTGTPPFATAHWSLAAMLVGMLATLPPIAGLWFTVRANWRPFRRLRTLVNEQVRVLFARCGLGALAAISLIAGIGEEALFRGVLQPGVARWTGDVAAAVLVGVVFGLAHAISGLYAILAGLMGVYLGLVFLLAGNVAVPIVVHALYDFIALYYLVLIPNSLRESHILSEETP